MRIVFMGTPEFAVPTLVELVSAGHDIAAVYTRPPAAAGRGMAEKRSPVHVLADRLGLPVHAPRSLKGEEATRTLRELSPAVVVVVAYGLLLPQPILDVPPLGCLNLHGSLLPRWRGAAPIQRAVMAGDAVSGVGVMRMEAGLDTGPVGIEKRVAITPEMTAGDLHDTLAPIGAALMMRAVDLLGRGVLTFRPQPEAGATYAAKIDKAEARIDWSRPAPVVTRLIQGLSPAPGAYFETDLGRGPERVKVLRARACEGDGPAGTLLDDRLTVACGEGAVSLVQLQRAGKAPMDADAFARGVRLDAGMRLAAA